MSVKDLYHKGRNITRIGIRRKVWGKECEVKLGQKWTKIRAKIASDDRFHGLSIPIQHCLPRKKRNVSRAPKGLMSISLTQDSNFNILGRKQSAIAVPCQIA